jgi:putative ABC transport system permease protein
VVEAVFLLSVAAGVLVLLAAVLASQDERLREGAVMRVLGGSRAQLRWAQAAEFTAIGLVAGGVATFSAAGLSWVVAQRLDLPWQADWGMFLTGGAVGVLIALASGLYATRTVARTPPNVVLRGL